MTDFVMTLTIPKGDMKIVPPESRLRIDFKPICKNQENMLNKMFAQQDKQYSELYQETKQAYEKEDIIKCYYNKNYIAKHHGKHIQAHLSFKTSNSGKLKLSRDIQYDPNATEVSDVEDEIPEEEYFIQVKQLLKQLSTKYAKTESQLTYLFVSVSGDVESMPHYLEGKIVVTQTYIEDLALSKGAKIEEFEVLVKEKGRDEVNKRICFLMQAQTEEGDHDNNHDYAPYSPQSSIKQDLNGVS